MSSKPRGGGASICLFRLFLPHSIYTPPPWKADCLACCHSIKKENNDTLGKTKRSCLRRRRVFYFAPASVPRSRCWKAQGKYLESKERSGQRQWSNTCTEGNCQVEQQTTARTGQNARPGPETWPKERTDPPGITPCRPHPQMTHENGNTNKMGNEDHTSTTNIFYSNGRA